MWVKIENKIVNLFTGIVIEIIDNPIERKRVIFLKKVGYEKDILLFESKNKKEVENKFKQIEKYIYKKGK